MSIEGLTAKVQRIAAELGAVRILLGLLGLGTAHTIGIFSRMDSGLIGFVDGLTVAHTTFQFLIAATFSVLAFHMAYYVIGVNAIAYAQLRSDYLIKKRKGKSLDRRKWETLTTHYRRHILRTVLSSVISTLVRVFVALLAFYHIYLGGRSEFILQTCVLIVASLVLLFLTFPAKNNSQFRKYLMRFTNDRLTVNALVMFTFVLAYTSGQARYDYLANTGCIKLTLGTTYRVASFMFPSSRGSFFRVNGASKKLLFVEGGREVVIEGRSFHSVEGEFLIRLPFLRENCESAKE